MNNRSFYTAIPKVTNFALLGFFTLIVAACGGGSSSDPAPTLQGSGEPITNNSPVVSAGTDQTLEEGDDVFLEGSATDDDGAIVSTSWSQTGGPVIESIIAEGNSRSFTLPATTENVILTFTFFATDNNGATASDSVDINVLNLNVAPIASAGEDQTVNEQLQVTLNGSGSEDPDMVDGIKSYLWVQTAGTDVTLSTNGLANTTFTAPAILNNESLTFELTVTDFDDDSHSDSINVNVKDRSLNDTGLVVSSDISEGTTDAGCEVNNQDCSFGRDAIEDNDGNGHAGFIFTKLAFDGTPGPENAAEWNCVRDEITGLVWESKSDDGGIHDSNLIYKWGGLNASEFGAIRNPDWNILILDSNEHALCGLSNWRVPTVKELETLV
ncbi:MAG: hypothetical protein COB51_03210, partial [Moraxellaceae bacterium]